MDFEPSFDCVNINKWNYNDYKIVFIQLFVYYLSMFKSNYNNIKIKLKQNYYTWFTNTCIYILYSTCYILYKATFIVINDCFIF